MRTQNKVFLEYARTLRSLNVEQTLVLFLNSEKEVIAQKTFTQQKEKETTFSARSIFAPALLHNTKKIVVIHNHPSGSVFPSQADYVTTLALAEGATILHMQLIDHLIVTEDDYFSFREAGIL